MKPITKELTLALPPGEAFQKFVHEFNQWWPPEYTWSQDKLEKIYIEARKDGLCTEVGPHGFRCDWGRVTALSEGESISFTWQISPKREPIPDPDKAGSIQVIFNASGQDGTNLVFKHDHFEKYGEGGADYREMMDSAQGWIYILERYKKYCEEET